MNGLFICIRPIDLVLMICALLLSCALRTSSILRSTPLQFHPKRKTAMRHSLCTDRLHFCSQDDENVRDIALSRKDYVLLHTLDTTSLATATESVVMVV